MWLHKSIVSLTIFSSFSFFIVSSGLLSQAASAESTPQTQEQKLSLSLIMSDPDWMGNSPMDPRWSQDEKSVYFSQKATGHQHQDFYRINLTNKQITSLSENDGLYIASLKADKNQQQTQGVFTYQDDLFLVDYQSGQIKPLSSDATIQSNARFIDQHKISYFQGHDIFIYDLAAGYSKQLASFRTENDPDAITEQTFLQQSQPRLLQTIKNSEAEKQFQKQREAKKRWNKNHIWYLGDEVSIETFRLSPDANWLVLGLVKKELSGKADNMPEFVTQDGYVKNTPVRSLVGTDKTLNETFYLVDLKQHRKTKIDTSSLPGINDDPLASLKKSAATKIGYKYKALQEPRAIYAYDNLENEGVAWSKDSARFAINLFSYDNKDRWIVGYDIEKSQLKTLHWLSDEAWINDWTFNEFGWLDDNQTLYYLSEEDGYSHLYIKTGKRRARQLTSGKFEVSDLTLSKDGETIFFRANKSHPGIYEIYSISIKEGKITPLTEMGGLNDYHLSPSEKKLLITHSATTRKPELYLVSLESDAEPVKLTSTMSEQFLSQKLQAPQIVEVQSSQINRSIFGRFYPSQSEVRIGENNKKPAVIFVHGAGYLQNAHQGWSGYFREYLFHNLLTQQGYAVLDLDYRASKGYGRDWRTAIYRQMGTPELEDLKDGVQWLIDNENIDPQRVGIYGGSYGGFMTFMALFKTPELFAAGAALRPVTDWAHYNHGYTSNMLNTPQIDPAAYQRSSPIEFAEGLNKPLLIAHGMVDDNVFFKDSVRLVQRLIELEKTRFFETAIYPVEGHGFKEPASWLDEYTRIYQLFERHLH